MPLPYVHTRRNESSSLRLDMYPYYSDIKFGKKAKRKKKWNAKKGSKLPSANVGEFELGTSGWI